MILCNISDIKAAMAHLLVRDSFDSFYLEGADVTTFAHLSVRGKRNRDWYDSGEQDADSPLSEWIHWSEMKSVIFSYIKGDKTPASMKIVLKADAAWARQRLEAGGAAGKYLEQRPELLLQFRYEQNQLCIVTGISHTQFTMDKQIEFAWDEAVRQYFKQLGIAFF